MAQWKSSSLDSETEKEIITGLITSDKYIQEIQPIFRKELLKIPYAKIVAQWCIDHYQKYKKAPNEIIQDLYNSYSNSKRADETQVELIGKFLSALSEKHEKNNNVEFSLDKAEKYFRSRHIEMLKEDLTAYLTSNKIDEAEQRIGDFKRIGRSKTVGIDIIRDNINSILFSEDDVLFRFPGALGELMSDVCRQDYIMIAAPMKRGKSWWLQEFGLKALMRGLNVVYYSFEMSEKKMIRRIYQNLLAEPKKAGLIEFPYFYKGRIEIKEIEKKGLSGEMIDKKRKQIESMINTSFRLRVAPTGSMNTDDIKVDLDNLDTYEHFSPDVIITDYGDIMAPEKGSNREERHKLNATQMALRGLAQERNAVVVNATQTTIDTFNKNIEEASMAEDKRKLAHATSIIALNQTKEDKKKNIMRIGMVVARDDEFFVEDEVIVLQCMKIGRPVLDSRWAKNIENL